MSRRLRNALYVLLLCAFVLTACGGDGGDDDAVDENTDAPVVQDDTDGNDDADDAEFTPDPQLALTPRPTTDFVAPPIGVLGEAATEDPEPGAPEPLGTGFSYIFFEQTGGIDDTTLQVEVYGDGRLTLNGEQQPNAPQAAIQEIARQIDEVDFFGMQATFIGPPRNENDYRYRMAVVQDGGRERLINAQDGYIPREIIRLLGSVRGLVNAPPATQQAIVPVPTTVLTPEATP